MSFLEIWTNMSVYISSILNQPWWIPQLLQARKYSMFGNTCRLLEFLLQDFYWFLIYAKLSLIWYVAK